MEVPDDIIALAVDEDLPLSQGIVVFENGKGLDQLRAAWSGLRKQVISLQKP